MPNKRKVARHGQRDERDGRVQGRLGPANGMNEQGQTNQRGNGDKRTEGHPERKPKKLCVHKRVYRGERDRQSLQGGNRMKGAQTEEERRTSRKRSVIHCGTPCQVPGGSVDLKKGPLNKGLSICVVCLS